MPHCSEVSILQERPFGAHGRQAGPQLSNGLDEAGPGSLDLLSVVTFQDPRCARKWCWFEDFRHLTVTAALMILAMGNFSMEFLR